MRTLALCGLALALVCLLGGSAEAGPLRNFFKLRRAAPASLVCPAGICAPCNCVDARTCGTCQGQCFAPSPYPLPQFAPMIMPAAPAPIVWRMGAAPCPDGKCPLVPKK